MAHLQMPNTVNLLQEAFAHLHTAVGMPPYTLTACQTDDLMGLLASLPSSKGQ